MKNYPNGDKNGKYSNIIGRSVKWTFMRRGGIERGMIGGSGGGGGVRGWMYGVLVNASGNWAQRMLDKVILQQPMAFAQVININS